MFAFIFLCMLFAHIVDDFCLQGILANMKQKSWWREKIAQCGDLKSYTGSLKCRNDWIPALMIHGMSWSYMIALPCNIYFMIKDPDKINLMVPIFVVNFMIHSIVDHKKCNEYKINLIQDQFIHLLQIIFTYVFFLFLAQAV